MGDTAGSTKVAHDVSTATALVRPLAPLLPPGRDKALQVPRLGLVISAAKALEQRRLFVLLPFAIICGLIAYTRAGATPDPAALIGIALALLIGIIVCWRSIVPLRVLVLALAFWLGFSLLAIHGALFGTAMLHGSAYGNYEARVDEIISSGEEGARIIISAISPVAPARAIPIRRARIAVKGQMAFAPGDMIRAPIRFYPVPGPVLPGGFDSQFHGYFDGIGAFGNATGAVETIIHGNASAPERMIEATRRGHCAAGGCGTVPALRRYRPRHHQWRPERGYG